MDIKSSILIVLLILSILTSIGRIFAASEEDLVKATQNPVSDLINLPLQNNINFEVGPNKKTQNVLNIQPVEKDDV